GSTTTLAAGASGGWPAGISIAIAEDVPGTAINEAAAVAMSTPRDFFSLSVIVDPLVAQGGGRGGSSGPPGRPGTPLGLECSHPDGVGAGSAADGECNAVAALEDNRPPDALLRMFHGGRAVEVDRSGRRHRGTADL